MSTRLEEQDTKLAPSLLEHKLETSRLSALHQSRPVADPGWLTTTLGDIQILFSVLLFFIILNPPLDPKPLGYLPSFLQPYASIFWSFCNVNARSLNLFCSGALALVTLPILRMKPLSVMCLLPLLATGFDMDESYLLTLACVCVTIVAVAPVRHNEIPTVAPYRSQIVDTLSDKFIKRENTPESPDTVSVPSSTSFGEEAEVEPVKCNSPRMTPPANNMGNLLSVSRMSSPLLRISDSNSLNHEFVTEHEKDCDIASLSLGEEEPIRPSTVKETPFSPRVYSPENQSGIKFTGKPVLRPSRLSWVAGGYWTPPNSLPVGEPVSRSSSQSSGFVSASGTCLLLGQDLLKNVNGIYSSCYLYLSDLYLLLPSEPTGIDLVCLFCTARINLACLFYTALDYVYVHVFKDHRFTIFPCLQHSHTLR